MSGPSQHKLYLKRGAALQVRCGAAEGDTALVCKSSRFVIPSAVFGAKLFLEPSQSRFLASLGMTIYWGCKIWGCKIWGCKIW